MAIATFVEHPQTFFSDLNGLTPARDRGWIVCPHGTSWPSDNFVTRPSYFQIEDFKQKTFLNHQRRFPDCDCTLG